MNSSSACVAVLTVIEATPGRSRAPLAICSHALDGRAELEMDGEVDGVAQVAGGVAQVVDDQRESGGQRQRHTDDR